MDGFELKKPGNGSFQQNDNNLCKRPSLDSRPSVQAIQYSSGCCSPCQTFFNFPVNCEPYRRCISNPPKCTISKYASEANLSMSPCAFRSQIQSISSFDPYNCRKSQPIFCKIRYPNFKLSANQLNDFKGDKRWSASQDIVSHLRNQKSLVRNRTLIKHEESLNKIKPITELTLASKVHQNLYASQKLPDGTEIPDGIIYRDGLGSAEPIPPINKRHSAPHKVKSTQANYADENEQREQYAAYSTNVSDYDFLADGSRKEINQGGLNPSGGFIENEYGETIIPTSSQLLKIGNPGKDKNLKASGSSSDMSGSENFKNPGASGMPGLEGNSRSTGRFGSQEDPNYTGQPGSQTNPGVRKRSNSKETSSTISDSKLNANPKMTSASIQSSRLNKAGKTNSDNQLMQKESSREDNSQKLLYDRNGKEINQDKYGYNKGQSFSKPRHLSFEKERQMSKDMKLKRLLAGTIQPFGPTGCKESCNRNLYTSSRANKFITEASKYQFTVCTNFKTLSCIIPKPAFSQLDFYGGAKRVMSEQKQRIESPLRNNVCWGTKSGEQYSYYSCKYRPEAQNYAYTPKCTSTPNKTFQNMCVPPYTLFRANR